MRRTLVVLGMSVVAAGSVACSLLVDTSGVAGPVSQSDGGSLVDTGQDTLGPIGDGGDSHTIRQPIALVQSAGGYVKGVTYDQAFPVANAAGNTIVVYAFRNGGPPMSVADSRGNTYQSIPEQGNPGSTGVGQIFFAQQIVGGANTLVLTVGGVTPTDVGMAIFEYSGLATTGTLLDGYAGQFAPAPTAQAVTPPVTTTFANDLLLAGFCNVVGGGDILAGAGWNPRFANPNFYMLTEDRLVSSVGSYSAEATMPRPDSSWVALFAAFRGAP